MMGLADMAKLTSLIRKKYIYGLETPYRLVAWKRKKYICGFHDQEKTRLQKKRELLFCNHKVTVQIANIIFPAGEIGSFFYLFILFSLSALFVFSSFFYLCFFCSSLAYFCSSLVGFFMFLVKLLIKFTKQKKEVQYVFLRANKFEGRTGVSAKSYLSQLC